jgi:hypothetical protein
MRRADMREKILQVGTRLKHQRASEFTVKGMLDDHVENPDAVVEKNLKLLFGALGRVLARQDRSMGSIGFSRQTVARRRRQNFFAARAEDRYVLDQTLAAYAEMFRDLAAGNGSTAGAEPPYDLAPPAARRIPGARLRQFSGRCPG